MPTINIGSRQQGRERPESVIDVDNDTEKIVEALHKALFDKEYRASLQSMTNPFGDGKSAPKIFEKLKTVNLDGIIQKRFYE